MADDTSTTGTTSTDGGDTTSTASTSTDTSATDNLGDAGKKALDAERTRANDAEKRAKAAEKELEKLRTAALSDNERAVAEAKAAGKTEAATDYSKRLAKAELKAAAAAKGVDLNSQLDYLDLTRFVTDGEPDTKAIEQFVEQAAGSSTTRPPSFDGGARTTAGGKSMNQIFREAAGRA
jgi:hypothetical protein